MPAFAHHLYTPHTPKMKKREVFFWNFPNLCNGICTLRCCCHTKASAAPRHSRIHGFLLRRFDQHIHLSRCLGRFHHDLLGLRFRSWHHWYKCQVLWRPAKRFCLCTFDPGHLRPVRWHLEAPRNHSFPLLIRRMVGVLPEVVILSLQHPFHERSLRGQWWLFLHQDILVLLFRQVNDTWHWNWPAGFNGRNDPLKNNETPLKNNETICQLGPTISQTIPGLSSFRPPATSTLFLWCSP